MKKIAIKFIYVKGQEVDPEDVKIVWDDGSKHVLQEKTLKEIVNECDFLDFLEDNSEEDWDRGYDKGYEDGYGEGKTDIVDEILDVLENIRENC